MDEQLWPDRVLVFLHDVAHCLALTSQGTLQVEADGSLSKASLEALARCTSTAVAGPERAVDQAVGSRRFLVSLLGRAGALGDSDGALRLNAAAHEWLAQPGHVQLQRLRETWFLALDLGWRWLPADRRKRPLDSHWRAICLDALSGVVGLPVDSWSPVDSLIARLQVAGVLVPGGVPQNWPHVRRSAALRAQSVLGFLFEVILPGLGFVETRAVAGDGVYLRPTAEGAAWLRTALARSGLFMAGALPHEATVELSVPASPLRFPAPTEPALTVEPDLYLAVPLAAPAVCTFEIAHVAELVSAGPPTRYRLTRESLRQAVAWGYPVSEVLFLLAQFSHGSLPAPAVAQIAAWQGEMAVVLSEPGYRLHLAAPEVLTALRRRDPFRRRTLPFSSAEDAWVGEAEAPELFRYLRRVGYELQGREKEGANGSGSLRLSLPLSRSSMLPLSQLLIVLRTYRQLRRLVPGLADLDVEPLDGAIAAVLAPDDLAGVERLAASHLVFLRHHLRRTPPDERGTPGDHGAQVEDGRPGEVEPGEQRVQESRNTRDQENGPGQSEAAASPPLDLEVRLQAAVLAGGTLELTYVDAKGVTGRRRVRPLHLETRWGRRYLLAYCELRGDERHFRLDRIVDIHE